MRRAFQSVQGNPVSEVRGVASKKFADFPSEMVRLLYLGAFNLHNATCFGVISCFSR
jgi:hypothetical protein